MKIEKNSLMHYIVYWFSFSLGNQCLQQCIHISTLLSLGSLILTASVIPKGVERQKSKMELFQKLNS
jgi:hypothetical protein